jgi:hypothetical protein
MVPASRDVPTASGGFLTPNGTGPDPGYLAFETGRVLNRIRWLMELRLVPQKSTPSLSVGSELGRAGSELARLIRLTVDDYLAAGVERVFAEATEGLEWLLGREDAGDAYVTMVERYVRAEGGDPGEGFEDLNVRAVEFASGVRSAAVDALSGRAWLVEAVELGELVDHGLRPRNVMRYCVAERPNPRYWTEKRSARYRRDQAELRRAVALRREPGSPEPDRDEERSPRVARRRGPASRPVRYTHKLFWPPSGGDVCEPLWTFEVRSRWGRMGLPPGPTRFLRDAQRVCGDPIRRGAIVRLLDDERWWAGWSRGRVGSGTGQAAPAPHSQPVDLSQGLEARGTDQEDAPAVAGQKAATEKSATVVPEDDLRGTRGKKLTPEKRAAREQAVQRILKKEQNFSLQEVARRVGLRASSVSKTEVWQKEDARRKKSKQLRDHTSAAAIEAGTSRLEYRKRSLDGRRDGGHEVSASDDPSSTLMYREGLQAIFQRYANAEEKKKARELLSLIAKNFILILYCLKSMNSEVNAKMIKLKCLY